MLRTIRDWLTAVGGIRMRAWVLFIMMGLGSCQQQSVEEQMQAINDQVARDAVEQYDIAASSGSSMDKCVQAGLVSAAYLQAKREEEYRKWKTIENGACVAAGVPR